MQICDRERETHEICLMISFVCFITSIPGAVVMLVGPEGFILEVVVAMTTWKISHHMPN